MRPRATTSETGFTTIELMVVVGVLAIFMGLAGPALSGMIASQQARGASTDLHATLNVARSEALTRNASVTVTPVESDWSRGWTITDAGGSVLRRQSAFSRVALSGPTRVVFNGDGRPDNTTVPFSVTATEGSSDAHRCVRLRLSGRSAIDRGAC